MSNGRIDELLTAYDEKEDAKFKELIKNYLSYAVDNEILKLAQNIVKSPEWLESLNNEAKKAVVLPPPPVQDFSTFVEPEHVKVNLEKKTNEKFDVNPTEFEGNEEENINSSSNLTTSQQDNQNIKQVEEDDEEFDLR